MAIYTYQSSGAIIAKVFRDLRIQDAHWVNDAVEWIGEALQAIGSVSQLEQETLIRKTSSFKASLPTNLVMIDEVRYGYYNVDKTKDNPPKIEDFPLLMPYEGRTIHPAMASSYRKRTGADFMGEVSFFIKGGMINTSFEEDWIAIVYQRISVDKKGFPMVPDHYSFSQALYWYIVMKMMEGGMEHPAGKQQINWAVAEDRWLGYCTQARTKALMPDPSKMREFQRNWVNILPNYDETDLSGHLLEYEEPSTLAGMAYRPIKDE